MFFLLFFCSIDKNWRNWTVDDVIQWIKKIDQNGLGSNEKNISQCLNNQNISGSNMVTLNHDDWVSYGFTSIFATKIVEHITQLSLQALENNTHHSEQKESDILLELD